MQGTGEKIGSRSPCSSIAIEETDVDISIMFNFFEFVRCIVGQKDEG